MAVPEGNDVGGCERGKNSGNLSSDARRTGREGEKAACRYLERNGWRIIECNFRAERYEIDIIALDLDTLVFCEVKASRTGKFGPSYLRVTEEKTKRIASAAVEFLAANTIECRAYRFDVVGIEIIGDDMHIYHIENAFDAPEDL